MKTNTEDFFEAYVEAALWSTTNHDVEEERHLDADYCIHDLAPETREKMYDWCREFLKRARPLIEEAECNRGSGEYSKWAQAGHDFWLTQSHHGCGFWDGDWEPRDLGERLTTIAQEFPEEGSHFVFTDFGDGKLHIT